LKWKEPENNLQTYRKTIEVTIHGKERWTANEELEKCGLNFSKCATSDVIFLNVFKFFVYFVAT